MKEGARVTVRMRRYGVVGGTSIDFRAVTDVEEPGVVDRIFATHVVVVLDDENVVSARLSDVTEVAS